MRIVKNVSMLRRNDVILVFNVTEKTQNNLTTKHELIAMDRLPYRQKFLNDRNSKICYHSLKHHPKVSKIAKFRCEML